MIETEIIQRAAFDYEALEADARTAVKNRTAEIHGLVRMTAQTVLKIGCKLIEVKPLLAGCFADWLQKEFSWSVRTAYNFMGVYETFGDEPSVSNFAPSALYLLSASSAPEEARRTAIEMAAGGETVTHQKARKAILHSLGRTKGADRGPEPKGMLSRLSDEPESAGSPALFYVNRLTMAIQNEDLDLMEDRLTYALHGLAELIKERVPKHPPKL